MIQITDTEIKQKGLDILVSALGAVDAERFITLLSREPFNYTRWQRTLFIDMSVEAISQRAMKLRGDSLSSSELDIDAH
ncbi:hypothetical protein [Puia sp.]|jgi:hypothetical protein|uniref:hypothetical protein n=1 Tax=Puia sp. TaxID=2045100 RepID=UPI002F4080DF